MASLTLAHIDCDAFYATVEKRDNPEIADKPVIIGGGKRGVVSAACYISRTFGVRSAMPMFKALALCPSAIVIRPDMAKYVRVGREVRHAMAALTPLVEPLSIDEAFLDLSGTQRVHGMIPAKVLARFAREVERDIGITVSVGLSCNKFLAKIASDLDKPRGFAALDRDEARAMLADKPVGFIFGVGPATQERLSQRGFRTIADLQRADEVELMKQFATEGRRLWRLARGIDDRRVVPDRGAKTISSETTFETDTRDFATLEKMLWRLSEKVSARLKGSDLAGCTITLKLKTADFRQRTRSQSIHAPTQLAAKIFAVSREMLAKEIDGTAFRLMGTGVSALRRVRRPTTPTCSTAGRPMPSARSTICAGNSATRRSSAASPMRGRKSRRSARIRRAEPRSMQSETRLQLHPGCDAPRECGCDRPHLHGLESLMSNLPRAPEMTKSL